MEKKCSSEIINFYRKKKSCQTFFLRKQSTCKSPEWNAGKKMKLVNITIYIYTTYFGFLMKKKKPHKKKSNHHDKWRNRSVHIRKVPAPQNAVQMKDFDTAP